MFGWFKRKDPLHNAASQFAWIAAEEQIICEFMAAHGIERADVESRSRAKDVGAMVEFLARRCLKSANLAGRQLDEHERTLRATAIVGLSDGASTFVRSEPVFEVAAMLAHASIAVSDYLPRSSGTNSMTRVEAEAAGEAMADDLKRGYAKHAELTAQSEWRQVFADLKRQTDLALAPQNGQAPLERIDKIIQEIARRN